MRVSAVILLAALTSLPAAAVRADNVYDPAYNTISAQTRNSSIFGLHNTVNKDGTLSEEDTSVVNNAAIFGQDNHVEFQGNISIDQATAVGTANIIKGTNDTAVGVNNTVDGSWSLAAGTGNRVSGTEAVAIGRENTASMAGTVAIGSHSISEGGWAAAIGAYAHAAGASSLAIGPHAEADKQSSIAIGYSSTAVDDFGIAIGGYQAKAAAKASAIGYAAQALGRDSIAAGTSTKALPEGSIALGAWSRADIGGGIYGYDPAANGLSTNSAGAWHSSWGALSIGDRASYSTRQITNLAAGTDDTDAVNVAQLKASRIEINGGDHISVTKEYGEDGHAIYHIDNLQGTASSNTGAGGAEAGSAGRETAAVTSADSRIDVTPSQTVQEGRTETSYELKLHVDGIVDAHNTGLMDGNAVYNETRVSRDGAYVRKANSAGENIERLDRQVQTNAADIAQARSEFTALGMKVDRLDSRIDSVGAGAAALAGLHPLDFDAADKWDFAAAYGYYRRADAAAVGAFYRPNEDIMFSVGGSLGRGETMLNAGVSMKFGKSSPYSKYSKAALVQIISGQTYRIEEINKENQALKAQMQEVLRQLADLQQKVRS